MSQPLVPAVSLHTAGLDGHAAFLEWEAACPVSLCASGYGAHHRGLSSWICP